jgi:hypothetical protein
VHVLLEKAGRLARAAPARPETAAAEEAAISLRRSVPLKLLWARGCAARGSAPLVLWCEGHGADRDCCGGASDVDHLQRME